MWVSYDTDATIKNRFVFHIGRYKKRRSGQIGPAEECDRDETGELRRRALGGSGW